jgi:uncharacterized protein
MKSDPFAQSGESQPKGNRPKQGDKQQSKPKEKEVSMEEKLAMLVNKFKK